MADALPDGAASDTAEIANANDALERESAAAQTANDPLDAPSAELDPALDPSPLESLNALHQALASKEQQAAEVQQQLVEARDPVSREELAKQLRELRAALADERQQFDRFALEIDLTPFVDEEEQPFDWQNELSKLLQPILAEIKSATAESRAIGELRSRLDTISERKELGEQAVERLQSLLQQAPSAALRERLAARLDYWQRIASETSNRYKALDLQLQAKLEQRQSVLDETASYARRFVQTRFGLDYRHQAIATTEVPQCMHDALAGALPELLEAEAQLKALRVSFERAGPSSLDYRIQVKLDGSAAPQTEIIRAGIQRILVDACNRHGWTIPFTQITLHQATESR